MADGQQPGDHGAGNNSPNFPGFPAPQGQQAGQQQPPNPQQVLPRPALSMEAVIVQLMQQLQQQQIATNQLLQQQQFPANPEAILDSLAGNIHEFHYDPDNSCTFAAWYERYDDLFADDARRIDDAAKVRLLLRRLGTSEHARYVSFILPSTPKDFNFAATVLKLKALFDTKESTVRKRFSTLTVSKTATEDFVAFGCRVNKMCVGFRLTTMTEEQFKCLIFVCGLKSECDAEVRTRLLSQIDDNANVTLESLMAECQRLINLKKDTAMIETPATPQVHAIKSNQQQRNSAKPSTDDQSNNQPREEKEKKDKTGKSKQKAKSGPSTPCWNCGAMHYAKFCTFRDHRCADCDELGHKEGYCISASSCKNKNKNDSSCNQLSINVVNEPASSVQRKRRYVPVLLNGVSVRMQLDTASDITIVSKEVWTRIGRPPTSSSSLGVKCASGEPLPLRHEFVCTVKILDIADTSRIFISNNSTLNLLGADIINQFNLWSLPMNAYCSQLSSSAISDSRSVSVNCVQRLRLHSSSGQQQHASTKQLSSKATADSAHIANHHQLRYNPAPPTGSHGDALPTGGSEAELSQSALVTAGQSPTPCSI